MRGSTALAGLGVAAGVVMGLGGCAGDRAAGADRASGGTPVAREDGEWASGRPPSQEGAGMPSAGATARTGDQARGAGDASASAASGAPAWTLGPTDAKAMTVNVAAVSTFASVGKKSSGKTLVIVRGAPPDCVCAGRTWTVKRYEVDADAASAAQIVEAGRFEPVREHEFVVIGGGGIGLVREVNREEKVEVVFDPAMMVMPQGLSCVVSGDSRIEQELMMKVYPLGDRTKVKSSGKVVNTIVYVGDETVTTGVGTVTARHVRSTFTADLSPAKVSNVSDQWFVDGVGLVREMEKETTKVLGVNVRNNSAEWVLVGSQGRK